MSATGTLGAVLYTSATPMTNVDAAADSIGDFQGLTITTEVGLIDNFGEFGKQFDLVTFQPVKDGRTRKFKGGYNSGQIQLTMGQDLTDAGQAALKAYADAANQNAYPFKITLVGADSSYDTIFFAARVMSFRTQMGAANSVVKASVMLEIDSDAFIGAAS